MTASFVLAGKLVLAYVVFIYMQYCIDKCVKEIFVIDARHEGVLAESTAHITLHCCNSLSIFEDVCRIGHVKISDC